MCSAYFGEISETRKTNWDSNENDPYGVLQSPICLEGKGHDLLDKGSRYFYDEIKIDWGSFAWKCTREQIIAFLNDVKSTLPWMIEREEKMLQEVVAYMRDRVLQEYAIVFIEES